VTGPTLRPYGGDGTGLLNRSVSQVWIQMPTIATGGPRPLITTPAHYADAVRRSVVVPSGRGTEKVAPRCRSPVVAVRPGGERVRTGSTQQGDGT
jgi:hypothetical protein